MVASLPEPTAKWRVVPVESVKSGSSKGPPEPKSSSAADAATVFDGVK